MTRRRAIGLVLWTSVGGVLGGCGQKGPLYFPPEPKEAPEEADQEEGGQPGEKDEDEKASSIRPREPQRHQARRAGRDDVPRRLLGTDAMSGAA